MLGLVFCLTLDTIMGALEISGHLAGTITTINGVLLLNPLVAVDAAVRSYYMMYFNPPLRKVVPAVIKTIFRLGPMAFMIGCSFMVHYFLLESVADGVEQNLGGVGTDVVEGIWSFYIYQTTANHPDLFMPLYNNRGWAMLVPFSFMVINWGLLMNLLLAVVADEHNNISGTFVSYEAKLRHLMLHQAFNHLSANVEGSVCREVDHKLMKEILDQVLWVSGKKSVEAVPRHTQMHLPHVTQDNSWSRLVTSMVELDGDTTLTRHEFCELVSFCHAPLRIKDLGAAEGIWQLEHDVLVAKMAVAAKASDEVSQMAFQVQLENMDSWSKFRWLSKFPTLHYYVCECTYYPCGTRSNIRISLDLVTIVLVTSLLLLELSKEYLNLSKTTSSAVNFLCAVYFLVENVLAFLARMMRHRTLEFFYSAGNWIDLLATVSMWLVFLRACSSGNCWQDTGEDSKLVAFSVMARLGRACRVLVLAVRSPRLAVLLRAFARMVPIVIPYFAMFIASFSIFAGIGMSLFAGAVTKVVEDGGPGDWSTAPWNATSYGQAAYFYNLNFDNGLSASFTLFCLLVQNNWHVIAEGFVTATGTRWTRVYFVTFNCLIEVVLLNVFIGVLLTVLSAIRADELAKYRGEDRPEMAFKAEVQARIDKIVAPSGHKYSEVWEVYEANNMSTEEMKMDQAFLLAEDTFQETQVAILDKVSMSVPMVGRTKEGYVCYVNEAFCTWAHADSKAILETQLDDYFTPEFASSMQAMHGKSGHIIWNDDVAAPTRAASGMTWKMNYAPLDFNVSAGGDVMGAVLGSSDEAGRGMLFWFSSLQTLPPVVTQPEEDITPGVSINKEG